MSAKKRYSASSRIKERGNIRRRIALMLKALVLSALLISPIFLLRADFMQIQNMEVVGAQVLNEASIKELAASFATGNKFLVIPKSNIMVFDEKELADNLAEKYGRLESVEINKKLYNKTLEIKVKERKSDFLWCAGNDECYFMSSDGVIFEKSLLTNIPETLIFRGAVEGDPLRKSFATTEAMTNYLSLVSTLDEAGFPVSSINIQTPNKAYAATVIGDVIFNPEENNLNLAGSNAATLIKSLQSKHSTSTFEYIDARFGNKVFYKLK